MLPQGRASSCAAAPAAGVSSAAGKIVCISSVHENIPWAGHANYAASKGGVAMLVATMAQELAASKVRVNRVAPGAPRSTATRGARPRPRPPC
ncbi:MAG: SDR family NAD(P)-dependent oxidoreductase [Rubrivivax sp.]